MEQLEMSNEDSLLARARAGDRAAYAELFEVHRDKALRVARRIAGTNAADDLVAEAFANVLRVLDQGGGPTVAFGPYLMAAIRNAHLHNLRRQQREVSVGEFEALDERLAVTDDHIARGSAATVADAMKTLPDRWQQVLWLTAVEGRSHNEVGLHLGLKANAARALAFRAREGLREAYLAAHLGTIKNERCRPVVSLLPAYIRTTLARPRRAKVDSHLRDCGSCSNALVDLRMVNTELGALLLPSLAGALTWKATSASLSSAGHTAEAASIATATPSATGGVGVVASKVAAVLVAAGVATGGMVAVKESQDPPAAVLAPADSAVARSPAGSTGRDPQSLQRHRHHDIPAARPRSDEGTAEANNPAVEPQHESDGDPSRTAGGHLAGTHPTPSGAVDTVGGQVDEAPPSGDSSVQVVQAATIGSATVAHDGTRKKLTVTVTNFGPDDAVIVKAGATVGAVAPSGPWSCEMQSDWQDGLPLGTRIVNCSWGAAGDPQPLNLEFDVISSTTFEIALVGPDGACHDQRSVTVSAL